VEYGVKSPREAIRNSLMAAVRTPRAKGWFSAAKKDEVGAG
jgi:hypothetical protein